MINVSIYGSCVSRGIFDIPKNSDKIFNVTEYIAKNSIFNLWDLPINLEDFKNIENPKLLDWNTRMVYYDLEKRVLDVLSNPSDIFVMDFIDERLGRILIDEYNTTITNSESFVRGNYIKFFKDYHEIRYNEISYFEIYRMIEKFCIFIKDIYPERFIFIIEAYPVIAYYNEYNSLNLFSEERIASAYRLGEQLTIYYEIIKELLPNANYIKFPYNTFANYNHKWGLGYVHYEDKFYEIALKKITEKIGNICK